MRFLIPVTLILVFGLGCGLKDSSKNKELDQYEWEEVSKFKDGWNSALEITSDDILYVAKKNELYRSTNFGATFVRISTPDSADIVKVRDLDRLYIIGNTFRPKAGSFVSWIYASEDDGHTWEQVTGGYIMQDLTFHDDRLHIGRKHGVTTIDLNSGETFRNSFIYSKLSDHIEEIKVTKDGRIFLASHDGLHASLNNGETWSKISTHISKDRDFFRSIEVDERNDLYVSENKRIYKILGDSLYWERYYDGYWTDILKLVTDNKILILSSSRLKISDRDELSFMEIQPESELEYGPFFDFLDTFSNGDIVLAGHTSLFIGRIKN